MSMQNMGHFVYCVVLTCDLKTHLHSDWSIQVYFRSSVTKAHLTACLIHSLLSTL